MRYREKGRETMVTRKNGYSDKQTKNGIKNYIKMETERKNDWE